MVAKQHLNLILFRNYCKELILYWDTFTQLIRIDFSKQYDLHLRRGLVFQIIAKVLNVTGSYFTKYTDLLYCNQMLSCNAMYRAKQLFKIINNLPTTKHTKKGIVELAQVSRIR